MAHISYKENDPPFTQMLRNTHGGPSSLHRSVSCVFVTCTDGRTKCLRNSTQWTRVTDQLLASYRSRPLLPSHHPHVPRCPPLWRAVSQTLVLFFSHPASAPSPLLLFSLPFSNLSKARAQSQVYLTQTRAPSLQLFLPLLFLFCSSRRIDCRRLRVVIRGWTESNGCNAHRVPFLVAPRCERGEIRCVTHHISSYETTRAWSVSVVPRLIHTPDFTVYIGSRVRSAEQPPVPQFFFLLHSACTDRSFRCYLTRIVIRKKWLLNNVTDIM